MEKLLTFVVNQERGGTTVNVFINKEGAEFLIEGLQSFIDAGKTEHWHLFTPEWGGDELTSNNLTLNDKNELMNLVTIWFYDDPNESDD